MKTIVFFLFGIVFLISFSGCPSPQPECYIETVFTNPEIFEVPVIEGESFTFEGVVESVFQEVQLTQVDLYCVTQSDEPRLCDRIFLNGDSSIYHFRYTVLDIQQDFFFKVVAYDTQDCMGEASVSVKVFSKPLREHTVTLGHHSETPGGFLDLENNQIYKCGTTYYDGGTAKPNAELIDIVHYYNPYGTYKASFFSPLYFSTQIAAGETSYADIKNWTVKNETKFKKGTLSDYENATTESLQAANPIEDYVIHLENGEVVFFKTAGEKYGVIKVEQLFAPAKNTDEITFSYKIQEITKSKNGLAQ